MDLAGAVDAAYEDLLDVGGAAGAGDQDHRAGLRGRVGENREELVEAGEQARDGDHGDVRGRQERHQARFGGAGDHDQGAGVAEGVVGAGDADVSFPAGVAQLGDVADSAAHARQARDAAFLEVGRVGGDGGLAGDGGGNEVAGGRGRGDVLRFAGECFKTRDEGGDSRV